MFDLFIKYFGENIHFEKLEEKPQIAFYLAKRSMYRVFIDDASFVLIQIDAEETFGASALKKQMNIYAEALQSNIAFGFDSITRTQRDALIKNRIPFIVLSEQIYLPFLGVILNNHFKKVKKVKTDKMMPATQQLFLLLLYQKEGPVLKSSAAERLGLTRTSITRASEQLLAMDLIIQVKSGKEIRIERKYEPKELLKIAKPYLINPIQSKIAVKTNALKEKWLHAGESALSSYSMLNAPKIPEAAMYKGNFDKKAVVEIDPRWEDTGFVIILELWKYDPFLFSASDTVDPVSLACSLADSEDERIEIAIDEMLEELEWY